MRLVATLTNRVARENTSCANSVLIWCEENIFVKMAFTEHEVIVMHAELAAISERAHKLILVRKIAAFHRLEQMHHIRILEKLAVWRERKVLMGVRYWSKTLGRVYSVENSKHCGIEVYFEPRRPPTPQDYTENISIVANRRRQGTTATTATSASLAMIV